MYTTSPSPSPHQICGDYRVAVAEREKDERSRRRLAEREQREAAKTAEREERDRQKAAAVAERDAHRAAARRAARFPLDDWQASPFPGHCRLTV